MSYQVLARKWRPNRFGELVGQEHVVTAISNALDNNRLHHAYLFTGTRGVGKTTIARIFSKSLNCEQGLSATPCGQCGTCQEIENGNFIDLLEIDAASRTKVEDTRELLDNVQYKPSRGRYKVYLIDEVHMLSKHSFNALLKTLEEPPPHVKFLLATTDPQKLPVTILSRCLQFNLKALSRSQIAQQLEYVLGEEQLQFDKDALNQLARAAQGSMRDALSLTDQAIAQGNGVVGLQIVTDMLGLMDKNQVLKLVHSIAQKDSAAVMQQVETMANQAPDFGQILAEIMSLLHQVALTQFVPDACKLETISARAIFQLAKSVPAEQVQLMYQIALSGKKDLPHAADARTGLEMTLLRMLAFCPGNLKLSSADLVAQTPEAGPITDTTVVSTVIEPVTVQPAESIAIDTPMSMPVAEHTAVIEPKNDIPDSVSQNVDPKPERETETETEQQLFEQQQNILAEAQSFGHQPVPPLADFNESEPVALDQPYSQEPYVETVEPQVNNVDASPEATPAPPSSTADLIALRNKIIENQSIEEENAEQVKKSERTELPNLASIRQQNQKPQNVQNTSSEITSEQIVEPEQTSLNQVESAPVQPIPVALEPIGEPLSEPDAFFSAQDMEQDSPFATEPNLPKVESPNKQALIEAEAPPPPWEQSESEPTYIDPNLGVDIQAEPDLFDPNAHLDEGNVGEVTLDVPAFLPNKQKVSKSMQLDDWSRLIEDMQINALTKQLALHSSFNRNGDTVTLTLLEGKEHLDSQTARQLLKQALSNTLNTQIELEIIMGQPINTPYGVQIKINQVRREYAFQVVKTDQGIQLLKDRFSANVVEQSIQAR